MHSANVDSYSFTARRAHPATVVLIALLSSLLFQPAAQAEQPTVGEPLIHLDIKDMGVLVLTDEDKVSHSPWSSKTLLGKPTYLQHLAARIGVDTLYKPISDILEARQYNLDLFNSVAIVNRDDAAWGTGALVTAKLKSNKKRYPDANIVVDTEGKARERWSLQPKTGAIMVIDANGKVLFFKEGSLDDTEIATVVELLDEQIKLQ